MLSKTTIPLKIAGSGPLKKELKQLAKNDSRIEFLGFISDEELIQHYAKAYAVLFVPYDEDYGLITIEAAMCKKPILTFTDAGGVVEFVEHKITGLISKPNINFLAQNIDYISGNQQFCKAMGQEMYDRVKNITWENTIESLLHKPIKEKNKITVVTTYGIYPPRGGGQNRIFYLYKELAQTMIVDIVCLVNESEIYRKTQIAPNLFEIRVPKSKSHAKKELDIEKKAGISITDIAMIYLYKETPNFIQEIKNSAKTSNIVITSHPYTYPLLKEYVDLPIIHESHNVEYNLKKQMLQHTKYNQTLLRDLFEVEKECCTNSMFTTVCAYDDAVTMQKIYDFDKEKAIVVPNGVDLSTVPYVSKEQRLNLQRSYNFKNEKIVLFIGSWHQPNIDAVYEICTMAEELNNYKFLIMGSVGKYFEQKNIKTPNNVGFTGITTDKEKEIYLSIVNVAINPMLSGSGTNLKMLDYMANGVPVVSTQIGARGLNIPVGYIAQCKMEEFTTYIPDIQQYTDVEKSRQYVEKFFSWQTISENFKEELNKYK